jgi:hypothetical protein
VRGVAAGPGGEQEAAEPAVAGRALALLAEDAEDVRVDQDGAAVVGLREPVSRGADLHGALDSDRRCVPIDVAPLVASGSPSRAPVPMTSSASRR